MKYRVAVIGAGVIGLTSALEIQKNLGKDVNVTIFTSEVSPNTTGDVSAGLWTPYLLQNTPIENIIKWADITQNFIHALWKNGLAEETGVSLMPMIHLSTTKEDYVPEWSAITFGGQKLTRNHLDKLGKEHNTYYKGGFSFVSFTCEPTKLLPYLTQTFIRNGGALIKRKVENIEELSDFDLVVNCTGLNSKYLVDDQKMVAIRGQIARVKAGWQYHCMMDDDHYIIPNTSCVILGGTHQENDFSLTVCPTDKEYILNGCSKMVPSLRNAEIQRDYVGLRPGREEVRISSENMILKNGSTIKVVHNYGHGGSGVTMCVGCAEDACELVRKQLGLPIVNSKM